MSSDVLKGTCVVEFVSYKNGMYSIKGGDGQWYGCYKTAPECEKGDEITFDYKKNQDYNNVVKGSIEVIGHTAPAEQPTSSNGGGGKYTPAQSNNVYDNTSYWKAKFDHDVLRTQPEIRYAAARKSAVDIVGIALSNGAIELPASKTKGAKLTAVLNYVNEATSNFADECEEYVALLNQVNPVSDSTEDTETDEE